MSHRLMEWLQLGTRLVLVQSVMVALTVLGLGVLGAAPAATAAARVVGPIRRDEAIPVVTTMWRTWRSTFWSANLACAPAGALAVAAAGNLVLLTTGGAGVPAPAGTLLVSLAALIGLLSLVAWLIAAVLGAEEGSSPGQVLRTAVLLPLAAPGTAVSMLVTLTGVALIAVVVPVWGVLCGASVAILAVELLVSTRRRLLQERLVHA